MFGKRGLAPAGIPVQHIQQQAAETINIDVNPQIPSLPRFPDKSMTDVRYMLITPYVSVHIYWNEKISEVVYEIEEPVLNDTEKYTLIRVENGMRELINVNMLVEKS